jgi:hypothetical protein
MLKNYSHITVILDRTGSMESIRDDTIGGFNSFLNKQKAEPGKATMTLIQFDSQDPYEVIHHFKPIGDIPELTYDTFVPRAATPLLDAIGQGINDLEKSVAELKKNKRPSKVVMVIITDGQENASLEFTKKQIVKMIKNKTDKLNWQFVFLSADLGAIGDALSVGFNPDAVLLFAKDSQGTKAACESLSNSVSSFRSYRKAACAFEYSDRKHPADPLR